MWCRLIPVLTEAVKQQQGIIHQQKLQMEQQMEGIIQQHQDEIQQLKLQLEQQIEDLKQQLQNIQNSCKCG